MLSVLLFVCHLANFRNTVKLAEMIEELKGILQLYATLCSCAHVNPSASGLIVPSVYNCRSSFQQLLHICLDDAFDVLCRELQVRNQYLPACTP